MAGKDLLDGTWKSELLSLRQISLPTPTARSKRREVWRQEFGGPASACWALPDVGMATFLLHSLCAGMGIQVSSSSYKSHPGATPL